MNRILDPQGRLDLVTQFDGGAMSVTLHRESLEAYARVGRRPSGPRPQRSAAIERDEGHPDEVRRVQRQNRFITARRYAVANALHSHVTLTVQVDEGRSWMAAETKNFFRRLKDHVGWTFPFVWVVEGGNLDGQSDIRTHVHALVPVDLSARIQHEWKHGHAHVDHLRDVDDVRRAAQYITKALPSGQGQQLRTGRGFKPQPERVDLESTSALPELLLDRFGSARPNTTRCSEMNGVPVGFSMFWLSSEK